jgi:hypothetical protein
MPLSSDEMTLRIGIVALALVACKERDPAPTPAAGSGTAAGGGTAAVPVPGPGATRTGTGPSLPAVPDAASAGDGPPIVTRDGFAAETRDEAWAAETERAIGERLQALSPKVECRTTQCRIALAAPDHPRLADAIATLEAPDGLGGIARNMLVEAAQPKPDGTVELVVYASIPR